MADSKPTILCLHGCRQNGEIMRKKIEKLLGSRSANFICPTGNFLIEEAKDESGTADSLAKYGWWHLPSRQSLIDGYDYNFSETDIELIIKDLPKIDYIIGFSQGTVLATILLGHKSLTSVKGVILMAGTDIVDSKLLFEDKITVPSLSISGIKDELASKEQTEKLASYYTNREFYEHRWGHVIVSDSTSKNQILKFYGEE